MGGRMSIRPSVHPFCCIHEKLSLRTRLNHEMSEGTSRLWMESSCCHCIHKEGSTVPGWIPAVHGAPHCLTGGPSFWWTLLNKYASLDDLYVYEGQAPPDYRQPGFGWRAAWQLRELILHTVTAIGVVHWLESQCASQYPQLKYLLLTLSQEPPIESLV